MSPITNLELLTRVLPENQDGAAFYVLWWETIHFRKDGKREHDGSAFRTVLELANAADQYAGALNVHNLYFCVSLQRAAERRKYGVTMKAIRNIPNSLLIKTFILDLDVKGAGYADTDQAMRELNAKCLEIGIPFPNVIIFSSVQADGSASKSGLHCYWVLNRALTREEWLPLARALKAALQKRGLRFDLGPPTNIAGILRPLGSLNRKYDPPGVARLAYWNAAPEYDVDVFRVALATYMSTASSPVRDDREIVADLAELADAVEYRCDRGAYARGRYDQMLALHFALAHLVSAKPALRVDAWGIIHRVVVANGRDISINEARFEDALTRTADRRASDEALTTAASIFRAARLEGWLPPHPEDDLDDDQRVALARAKRQLWRVFNNGRDRADAAEDAARLALRIKDPMVLAALAPLMALYLARHGWGEPTILDAIELVKGTRDVGLARWAQLKRHARG